MPEFEVKECKFNFKCLICSYYGKCKLWERLEFERQNLERLNRTHWWHCKTKSWEVFCTTCKHYKECIIERGLPYRKTSLKNVIINAFPDTDKIEVIYYKRPFKHFEESENIEPVDRKRLLKEVIGAANVYIPVDDAFAVQDLQRSIRNASKRSKDSFYGFAQANDWEYFFTLTFDPEHVDRYDDEAVKRLWIDFQLWCKRRSPDVKIIAIPERHKPDAEHIKGAIHFHGLMSNIRLDLVPAINPKTKEPLPPSKFGAPLLNIRDWKYGFSTLAVIPKEDNYAKVVNYLQKYVAKEGNIGYCQKRYYRTHNLLFKNKTIHYFADDELQELLDALGIEAFKDNDKMTVYRKKL